ncbi:SMI1/KNR4 family protein [Pseudomonas sp. NBRC 100443]|uniref:SMI1/KNR4 family protein n=1 Tax=Pseudomonas sp. NBRC 100443 TaxID=1113665 RepID=UPI0024A1C361|nr:SMI1/KNR4 family protein [Pseudomonas sp. NBRC 100443]GLU40004.1 hypothetical protein Pssp01_40970 [Pseudomonas sp. NBRC 100443]
MANFEKLKAELKHEFQDSIIFTSSNEVPSNYQYPPNWKNFGLTSASSPWIPAEWGRYKNRIPWTYNLLEKCLIGTALIAEKEPKLIYIFEDTDDYYFYIGHSPVPANSSLENKIHKLPQDIQEFYINLHNGFTFHPSRAMGPLPIEQQVSIMDLYDGNNPNFPSELTGIFHNGAGDYLCVTPELDSENASIWWHESPDSAEGGLSFWAVMDTWISIFLEDTIIQHDITKQPEQ